MAAMTLRIQQRHIVPRNIERREKRAHPDRQRLLGRNEPCQHTIEGPLASV
jgi:hypothetical protein